MRQQFKTTDVARLEIQQGWPDLPNLILNPDAESGAWGWTTTGNLDAIAGPAFELTGFTNDDNSPAARYDVGITAGAGQSVRAMITPLTWANDRGTTTTVYIRASGPSGSTTVASVTFDETDLGSPVEIATAAIPSDATSLRLYFSSSNSPGLPGSGSYFTFTDAWMICGPTAAVTASDPLTEPPWTNILARGARIEVDRDELTASVLTATIYDADLDPATDELIRPGKRCRLQALVAGEWKNLFTGLLDDPSTVYAVKDPTIPDRKRTQISLQVTDPATSLANAARPNGVGTLAELPAVLLGTGVPWNINGSTATIDPDTAVIVAVNDQASAIDQVAITRDSNFAYAWIDRDGVLQVWDDATISAASVIDLDEADYSDIAIDFDLGRLINSVTINAVRINAGTSETEEVSYGPFENEPSMREWGYRQAEFRIQGAAETSAADGTFAAAVLARNSTPTRQITGATIPLRTVAELEAKVLLDLYDLATISNTRGAISAQQSRITTIKHSITATRNGGTWTIDVGFSTDGSVAVPQVTPSPVNTTQTLAQLLRPIGEVTMWYGAKSAIPAGWLPCDGSTFSSDTYPALATLLSGTTLPNITDRFPIGAGTKSLGSSGGSPTVVLTDENLPPHTHTMNHNHTISTRTEGVVGTNTTRVAASSGAGATDDANTAPNAYSGSTGNGPGTSTPVDVLNPWRALWFIIRAA